MAYQPALEIACFPTWKLSFKQLWAMQISAIDLQGHSKVDERVSGNLLELSSVPLAPLFLCSELSSFVCQ